jgi:hypothetical protein
MATVTITRREAERGYLPAVCALTGEPTEDVKAKKFLWQPPWIAVLILTGLLPYLIVALILRKTMTVQLPLVRAKHGHWLWRTLFGVGGCLFSLALIILGAALHEPGNTGPGRMPVGPMLTGLGGVCLLVVCIMLIVLRNTSIRPAEITDTDITLAGVHQNFVDALEEERERDEAE